MVSLMQNDGKTDIRKTMITFSFDDFSALKAKVEFLFFWLFHQFTTQRHYGLI